jgi:hypothetical protein
MDLRSRMAPHSWGCTRGLILSKVAGPVDLLGPDAQEGTLMTLTNLQRTLTCSGV